MNLHPLFVHFPIALWVVYALLEFATIWVWRTDTRVVWLKGVMVILGTLTAVPTIFFGFYAEEQLEMQASESLHRLVEAHETFALGAFIVFFLIALFYAFFLTHNPQRVAVFFSRWGWGVYVQRVFDWKALLGQRIIEGWWVKALALVGFAFVFIAGALGAAVAHGPEADVIVQWVVHTLGVLEG